MRGDAGWGEGVGGGDRLSVSLCFLEWATSQEVKRLSNDSG